MADKKISALTGATTPLAGTEVLPIVQSGATVKVAVADLTAGRAVSASSVTASTGDITSTAGNFVVGTSGKGIDFSADPSLPGMTSELLDDYEEGTWTPNQGSGLSVVGTFSSSGTYTRVGRLVNVTGNVQATTVGCGAAGVICSNLPFNTNGKAFNGSVGVSNANQSASVVVAALDAYCGSVIAATSAAIGFTVTYES
jgi:hypothetical protein